MQSRYNMKEKVEALRLEITSYQATTPEEIEEFRLKYISRKGVLTALFSDFKSVQPEQRKEVGGLLNSLKTLAQEKFQEFLQQSTGPSQASAEGEDITLPPPSDGLGGRHPISATQRKIIEIFERIGFNLSEGPEIESDWNNFSALNFPPNHPARAMQDTFFVSSNLPDQDMMLRTHTSSVQVRVMENRQPPIRTISPGRVYRNEAISARAHCIFHQIEGLYVDQEVSFADLKETLYYFVRALFGPATEVRLRASYFPFTEPSAEIDISCFICSGKGCKICKHTGWVEIGGAGMVDPNVLDNCKIDSKIYSGFAFGVGVERITMLLYQIDDLRLFTENDIRFLKQFCTCP